MEFFAWLNGKLPILWLQDMAPVAAPHEGPGGPDPPVETPIHTTVYLATNGWPPCLAFARPATLQLAESWSCYCMAQMRHGGNFTLQYVLRLQNKPGR